MCFTARILLITKRRKKNRKTYKQGHKQTNTETKIRKARALHYLVMCALLIVSRLTSNDPIMSDNRVKLLGVYIKAHLKLDYHNEQLCWKPAKICMLCMIRYFIAEI